MNVLVVAPHPDDEAIGCGGTICLHVSRGDRVTAVFLTSGELGLKHLPRNEAQGIRESEAKAAADVLGLSRLTFLRCADWLVRDHIDAAAAGLRAEFDRESPDLIYLPHSDEDHPDHQACLPAVRAALRPVAGPVPRLLAYEVWTPLTRYDHVENISDVMTRKVAAVRCHRSQIGHFRYDAAVRGLNRYRGALAARCRYAEVFRLEEFRGK